MGDFNFRCELFPEVQDKSKEGKDFCAVNELAMSGDSDKIRNLFFTGDRLQRWMMLRNIWPAPSAPSPLPPDPHPNSFGEPLDQIPSILQHTVDVISLTATKQKVRLERSDNKSNLPPTNKN